MRKLALLSAIAAIAVGLAAPVEAGPPKQLTFEDDAMFQSGRLTAACGFPVWITIKGTLHITLRTDRNGVLHEMDAFGDWSIAFSAPTNDTSFSYKFGPARFLYPDGVAIGAKSIVTLTGINADYPGAPAEAGRTVLEGEVVFVNPEGVPFVDFTGALISQTGNIPDPAVSRANLCAALAG